MNYIVDNCLILIPVLYIVATILKNLEFIKDKYIPLILLPIGIALAIAIKGIDVNSVIQGILVTGVTVYGNQIFKQINKEE